MYGGGAPWKGSGRDRGDSPLEVLRKLDAFPKQREEASEFFHSTVAGGVITLVASFFMALLFFSELGEYLKIDTKTEMIVDTSRGESLEIKFDVSLHHMPCSWITMDSMDVSGDVHLDVDHDLFKRRLSASGEPIGDEEEHTVGPAKHDLPQRARKAREEALGSPAGGASPSNATATPCGSCYGAETEVGQCCDTCEEVRAAYRRRGWAIGDTQATVQCVDDHYLDSLREQRGEGCRVRGRLSINKVAGNFHIAPGKSYEIHGGHVHDLSAFPGEVFDFGHTIHELSFGEPYPGRRNPLDGVRGETPDMPDVFGFARQGEKLKKKEEAKRRLAGWGGGATTPPAPLSSSLRSGQFEYFLKVVPTSYKPLSMPAIGSNQFSVSSSFKPAGEAVWGGEVPGLFFFYDLSPIKVRYVQTRPSFITFFTSMCAIVGGIFTISGIVDAGLHHAQRIVRAKMQEGKQY